jgi:hypothetical protein
MEAAAQQALERQNANRLAHRVPGNAERRGQGYFLELGAGAELSLENALAQQGRDLVGDTDAIDLSAFHVKEGLDGILTPEAWKFCSGLFKLSSVEMLNNPNV